MKGPHSLDRDGSSSLGGSRGRGRGPTPSQRGRGGSNRGGTAAGARGGLARPLLDRSGSEASESDSDSDDDSDDDSGEEEEKGGGCCCVQ